MPPASISSRIDGTNDATESRASSTKSSAASIGAFSSTTISVPLRAPYQNGDTSRTCERRDSAEGTDSVNVQYGAHTSIGIAPGGSTSSSLPSFDRRTANSATSNATTASPPSTTVRRSGPRRPPSGSGGSASGSA